MNNNITWIFFVVAVVDVHVHPQPPRQNTRSSSWHEVLSTDDATLQEHPITVGDQLNVDGDDLICSFMDTMKKKKKKKKKKWLDILLLI